MKEPRTTTLVDAFERAAGSTPATPPPPSAVNAKAAPANGAVASAAASLGSPSAETREPSARMRLWCSEE